MTDNAAIRRLAGLPDRAMGTRGEVGLRRCDDRRRGGGRGDRRQLRLRGLASRIEHAVGGIGAVRVSLDSLGAIFSRYPDAAIVGKELHRIAHVLNRLGVTSWSTM